MKSNVMFLLGRCKDENIINEAQNALLAFKDLAHSSLRVFWCTGDPKWKLVETIPPIWCKEGDEMSVTFS